MKKNSEENHTWEDTDTTMEDDSGKWSSDAEDVGGGDSWIDETSSHKSEKSTGKENVNEKTIVILDSNQEATIITKEICTHQHISHLVITNSKMKRR